MKFYLFSSAETRPDKISLTIMRRLQTNYSHVGIIVEEGIYHSTGDGVNKKQVDEFLKDHLFVHKIDITRFVESVAYSIGWCDGNIGKDYSESQYLGIMFPKFELLKKTARWKK